MMRFAKRTAGIALVETPRRRHQLLASLVALPLLCDCTPAAASCNVIPGTVNSFRGALGVSDRPFAMPGDFVELTVRPEICDGASVGLGDFDSNGATEAADVLVTVLFEPPNASPRDAVVIATDCAAIASKVAACDSQPTVGHAACVQASGSDLVLAPGALESKLRFRFPDTDARVGTPTDDRTLAGPATIAVTPVNLPLPCGALAAGRCADTGGLAACIDELYTIDGSCETGAAQRDTSFGHFVALPPPNDYEAVCDSAGTPCDGTATELRFTTDAAGNAYLPFDYRGVLVRIDDVPIPRLVRGIPTGVDAFAGGAPDPIRIPGDSFLSSFSPEGHRLPPIFTPLRDPAASGPETLFGAVDAPLSVTRVARRGKTMLECTGGPNTGQPCNDPHDCPSGTCGGATCRGGSNNGGSCSSDAQCPGGECGPALFEFRDRYEAGIGPLVVADSQYDVDAESPIPIAGLNQTLEVFAFVRSEPIENQDLNGDGDHYDPVLTLRDHDTGEPFPIGNGGSAGRAVTQVHDGPFRYPIVEAMGDLVAFFESEPAQGSSDTNSNGQVFEPILRIFRLGTSAATEVTDPETPLTVDAAPLVGGQSVIASEGAFFFRTAEAAEGRAGTTRVSVDSNGVQGNLGSLDSSISADGRFVVYEGPSPLVPGDTNQEDDVFVHDRESGATTRVSVDSGGVQADAASFDPVISADGRFVSFASVATNLVSDDTNGLRDVFVHDRATGVTTRVSVDSSGAHGDSLSFDPAISADGLFVSFLSQAQNLVPGDTNQADDVFVHDRASAMTARVSVDSGGAQADAASFDPAISADGRIVAFDSLATNLVSDSMNGRHVFVHDRTTGNTARVSVDSNGVLGDSVSFDPAISADGRFVTFESQAGNLVPGDTNGRFDVFVHDRATGATTRVSVDSNGAQSNGGVLGFVPAISPDGRFVAFASIATDLVADDTNAFRDVFVHDRVTGATARVSLADGGAEGDGNSPGGLVPASTELFAPAISAQGRFIVFPSDASNLVPGDTNGVSDVIVRGPDPNDPLNADRTGDGELDDTVLRVARETGMGAEVLDLCPTTEVAVAGARAAFLRPETAGETTNPDCTGGSLTGPDLNGDGDEDDQVVHLWNGTTVSNLRCAATAVDLSGSRIAALVSEADADELGGNLNGDGDSDDAVLHVRSPTAPAGSGCDWINTGLAGTTIGVSGDYVAVLVSEASQGSPLNGDGDILDTVLYIWNATTGDTVDFYNGQGGSLLPPAAEEFVMGETLVAFRISEAAQASAAPPACSLNPPDTDCDDAVLHTVDVATGVVVSSGQAAVKCGVEACDPRLPYRIDGRTVRFLTLEAQQSAPLNGDGDTDDLVLQVFNVPSTSTSPLSEVSSGYCSDSGEACGTTADCGAGASCYVPPGACVRDFGSSCPCGSGQFCRDGSCHQEEGACKATADCTAGAVCEDADQQAQDVVSQIASEQSAASGEQVFASTGTCFEDRATACTQDAQCATGELCRSGTCQRAHGACAADADCPAGVCTRDLLITAAAADADADGLADPIDLCPTVADPDQADADADGIGDACDDWVCGNGVREGTPGDPGIEECDDGDQDPGDGCNATCQREAADCADGFDNDGDGKTDYGAGPSNDPGCTSAAGVRENPQCDDGVDNDFDGQIDHPADAKCINRRDHDELANPPAPTGGCGLGGELIPCLALLRWRLLSTRRRPRSGPC